MRRFAFVVVVLAIATSRVCAQQGDSAAPHVHVKVYANEPGLTPPQLMPLNLQLPQIDKCISKIDGIVELSLLVDTAGIPHNIMFVRPVGSDADAFALKIAAVDRYSPGTLNGTPVISAVSLKIRIQSCVIEVRHGDGISEHTGKLRATPVQELLAPVNPPLNAVLAPADFDWKKFAIEHPMKDDPKGGASANSSTESANTNKRTTPPVPIYEPEANYSEDASRRHITGTCLFSLLVDPQGMPKEIKIKKNLDPGLDLNAFKAVNGYRFKPAMLDGEPVPMWVNVEVTFILR
jgi:TonB family protein